MRVALTSLLASVLLVVPAPVLAQDGLPFDPTSRYVGEFSTQTRALVGSAQTIIATMGDVEASELGDPDVQRTVYGALGTIDFVVADVRSFDSPAEFADIHDDLLEAAEGFQTAGETCVDLLTGQDRGSEPDDCSDAMVDAIPAIEDVINAFGQQLGVLPPPEDEDDGDDEASPRPKAPVHFRE